MKKLKKLSNGSYGIVYHCLDNDGKDCAMKRNINKNHTCTSHRELDISYRLRHHPHIVSIKSIVQTSKLHSSILSPVNKKVINGSDEPFHLIMELAECNLTELIQRKTLDLNTIRNLLTDIVLGIDYIHRSELLHRDIKTDNILIFSSPPETLKYTAKICDFGLARDSEMKILTPGAATGWYRAPELFYNNTRYNQKVDVWAIGGILYYILFGKPYTGKVQDDDGTLVRGIIRNTVQPIDAKEFARVTGYNGKISEDTYQSLTGRFSKSKYISSLIDGNIQVRDDLYFLLRACLKINPKERPTCYELLQFSFFDATRERIENTLVSYPVSLALEYLYVIPKCKERVWAMKEIMVIRDSHYWLNDRIVAHTIDLYDRVLRYLKKKQQTLSNTDTRLYLYVCLFLMTKYFSSLEINVYYISELLTQNSVDLIEHCSDHEKISKIELFIITNVAKYALYRRGVYENLVYLLGTEPDYDYTNEMVSRLVNANNIDMLDPQTLAIQIKDKIETI